jgi:hypothetical protein
LKKIFSKKYSKLSEEKIIYKILKKTELVDEEELSILCKCDLIDILGGLNAQKSGRPIKKKKELDLSIGDIKKLNEKKLNLWNKSMICVDYLKNFSGYYFHKYQEVYQ